MRVTAEHLIPLLKALVEATPRRSLEDYLQAIPRIDSLADLPSGTRVLVRGDVDAKPGKQVGEGDIRLRSMVETLMFGRQRGWVQVIVGHIGRKPESTLSAVAARLGQLLDTPVELLDDWYVPSTGQITEAARARVANAKPGEVLVLENVRRYDVERSLWKAGTTDLPKVAPALAQFADALAGLAPIYVNEALSAGSLDASSTVVPAAAERVALGKYVAGEFDGPLRRCLEAQLVVFSGLKADKLDDMQAMIRRGTVRRVISAGSLAMALLKGQASLDGKQVSAGVAEDPAHADKPYYLPPDRLAQAEQMMRDGRAAGIEFVLPVDFVLADGRTVDSLGPGDQQLDVGPKTQAHFAAAVERFIGEHRQAVATGQAPRVAFYNGVFGMFEDPRFEAGTRHFVGQLQRMTEAGVEVYVGGGEGGTALERYGKPNWVTHCFTAGGTVLGALGAAPVPYLQALYFAATGRA